MNDPTGREVILDALNSKNNWEQYQALQQLARVKSPDQRSFAQARIKTIADDRRTPEGTRRAANNLRSGQ